MQLNYFDSAEFNDGLRLGTVSTMAAEKRKAVYFDAVKNLESLYDLNRKLHNFDQLDATGNMAPSTMGVALAEVSLKANINSILGYVAIERSMTQMTQDLIYKDIITKAGARVMPMIGQDNPRGRANQRYSTELTEGETDYSITLDACIAGSIAITFKLNGVTYQAMDDRKGNILSQAGLLSAGTINYATGKLDLTFANAIPANSTFEVCYALNKELGQGNNRTTLKQGYFQVKAQINKFEFEADLITAMISQKTGAAKDPIADLQQSVYDEQVLSINTKLVNTLRESYTGNTLNIDLSAFSIEGGFFSSMIQVFNTGLAAVDNAIAARCYKATKATAYIVGNGIATLFDSLEDAQGWVPNNTGYVNDVIGFKNGRAVIRHLDLDDYEGYAIVKTANGDLAPLGYGLLLPATNLPLVGNFANVNEIAGGIYSVDGTASITMDLAQRFTVKLPADWMVLAQA